MSVRVLTGDVRAQLAALADESVHCVVTSPPYYGLRDYGTARWEGGDAECDHKNGPLASPKSTLASYTSDNVKLATGGMPFKDLCGKCGATRVDGQIGLEATPEAHIAVMVEVFRDVRRVLRRDGVCWLNYGDGYSHGGNGSRDVDRWPKQSRNDHRVQHSKAGATKPKDLLMMPARVALALQADGWWLRSMMPWVKRSAMPESATDRPASAIEYVFLLTRSARYFFDMEAVRTADKGGDHPRNVLHKPEPSGGILPPHQGIRNAEGRNGAGRNFRNSDLFYQSLDAPHGLIGADDPLALDVNPAGFSGAQYLDGYDGGTGRIRSPDCPLHGDQDHLATKVPGGERQAASRSARTRRTSRRPAQLPPGGLFPTETHHDGDSSHGNSDLPGHEYSHSATGHSTESHKTALDPEISPHEITGDGSPNRIADSESPPETSAISGHKPGSNNEQGSDADGPPNYPSEQTAGNSADKCTCRIIDHFATFPPRLIEPLIKAGTSEKGCCAGCGAPWVREVAKTGGTTGQSWHDHSADDTAGQRAQFSGGLGGEAARTGYDVQTLGWSPSCACNADCVPATILDPFGGSGTTGLVADRLGRDCILIELNPGYADMARRRIEGDAGLFASVAAE